MMNFVAIIKTEISISIQYYVLQKERYFYILTNTIYGISIANVII